jgi:transporter family-2 protein
VPSTRSSNPDTGRRLPWGVALAGAVLVGVLTSIQAQMNGALSAGIGDGSIAAVISFGSGFVILLLLTLLTSPGRAGLVRLTAGVRARQIPFWMLIGGLAGAVTVGVQTVTVAVIGVATFTVGVVAGQTVNGMLLDRVGYGPGGVVGITVGRLAGSVLAVAAVVIALLGEGATTAPWWMFVLPFIAGAGIAWQQATNGRLRHAVDSALTATLMNFTAGSVALVAAAAVRVGMAGPPTRFPQDPWMYLGGTVGVVYIFLSAALVRHTGVLQLGLGSVLGLLATSVVIDAVWPAPAGPPLGVALAAVVTALVGVVIAVVPRWRRRPRAR